ncbi:MAG: hypothetical protein JRJ57_11335, partial [Deltaproteobacteria bacterium]|nr:hypothetical protein [Deltaproteobacteria bacterium]
MKDVNEEEEICTFLDRKLAHFKQYLSVTEKMKQSFSNKEEIRNLGSLISRRQGLVNKIESIDMSIGKILKKGSRKLSRNSNKYKDMIDSYLIKIRDVMTTVDFMDKEIMVMVKQEGQGIKTEVLKMRNFKKAARGYRGSS